MDYERLMADTYDAQYAVIRDPSGDAAFYAGLAARTGGPVLELGCGTGRVLLPIARTGLACTGVDPSGQMLRVLRAKQPPSNLTLVQGTMQTLELPERGFALVYMAFRAFQHLLTVADQLEALTRIRDHLRPDGLLAFDVFEPDLASIAIAERLDQAQPPFEQDGRMIERRFDVRRDHVRQVIDVVFRYVDVESQRELGTEQIAMRWCYRYELEHLLVRAGFEPLRWSSGYDGGPYVARGEIVVVARRAT
jgi:ubiquinone/menaquinone biosynthesis C-methylase UbiE